MGEAFRDGQRLGDAFGESKADVLKKLEEAFPSADEIRIRTLRESIDQAGRVAAHGEAQAKLVKRGGLNRFFRIPGVHSDVGGSPDEPRQLQTASARESLLSGAD